MNKPITLCDRCDIWARCCLDYDGNACRRNRTVEPTNADRIRAMSDGELARLHSTATACHRCEVPGCDGGHLNCYDIWLDWLQSPVEVEE